LAFCSDEVRACLLDGLDDGTRDRATLGMFRSGTLTRRIRADGFATHDRTACTLNPRKTSSIAVPVFDRERLAGIVALSYFSTAMPMCEAERRYSEPLKKCGTDIGAALVELGVRAQTAV